MVKIDIGKLKSLDVLKSRPKLTASDAASNDYFGISVAFSNNGLLAIGATRDDDNGQSASGSVYLFSGSGTNWTQQTKLTASDGADDNQFGFSVAFSNNGLLAIGATGDDDKKGSVYLFSGSGTNWTQQTKLTASDAASDDFFGSSVAFSNNGLLAIGAYGDDVTVTGSVYLFSGSGTNWTQQTKLTASDAASDDYFGTSVAFSNNGLLAIGAYGVDPGTTGAVYLFRGSGTNWNQIHKFIGSNYSSDTDNDTWFGSSVAFSNNGLLAIGAENDDDTKTGSVYLFSGSGTNWTQQTKLTASDAASNDYFGRSVAFSNNGLLAIGAYGDDANDDGNRTGSVYLYDLPLVKNKTKKKSLIQLSDSEVNDYANETHYNGITILGIVKTTNVNGDKINYLVLDNDPNNVYGRLLKIKNDNTISITEKIAEYENYQRIYEFSAEIYNYIESLLNN